MHLCLPKDLSLKLHIMDEQVRPLWCQACSAGCTCGIPAVGFKNAVLVQEALAQREQEAEAEEAQRLAQDLTERLRELRESRERRRQAMHA